DHRKGVSPVSKVENGMNMRADASFGGERVDRRQILAPALGKAAPIFTRAYADDRKAFDQRHVHRNLRDPARGKADDKQPPVKGDATRRFVEDVPAHRVEDEVGPLPARDRLYRL